MSDEDRRMYSEVRGALILVGYPCSHDHMSAAFGVEPSETWNVGDRTSSGRRILKQNGWRFWSSLPLTVTQEEHETHLLNHRTRNRKRDWQAILSRKGGGVTYINPNNNNDRIRVMPGDPSNPYPHKQRPYVVDQNWGAFVSRDSQRIGGSKPGHEPDAHIPYDVYFFWR